MPPEGLPGRPAEAQTGVQLRAVPRGRENGVCGQRQASGGAGGGRPWGRQGAGAGWPGPRRGADCRPSAGLGCLTVSFLVSLYYNTVLTWVLWYFLNSFQNPLPWGSCPLDLNRTGSAEGWEARCPGSQGPRTGSPKHHI